MLSLTDRHQPARAPNRVNLKSPVLTTQNRRARYLGPDHSARKTNLRSAGGHSCSPRMVVLRSVCPLYVCCISTLFEHIEVYDAGGHRVLSKMDLAEQQASSDGKVTLRGCSCSGWVLVPPHTIEILEYADISDGYLLSPGRYVITERTPAAPSNPNPEVQKAASHPPPGLAISIP